MLNVKHAVLLLMLLPACAQAAEPSPAAGQSASSPAAGPAQPSPSARLAPGGDAQCDMVTRFNATYWYQAALCAQRHTEMRPQEEEIKQRIARTYPGFHRAITTVPYSALGRATLDNLPFLPDSNPMLTEDSCRKNFVNMTRSIKDAKTRQTILQCWEQPRAAATGEPASPLDDKVCVGAAQYMASAWYRAGLCTTRHKGLAAREAKIKERIAATYPDFQQAISTPPILDAGKYMATYSLSQWGNDPSLSQQGCEENLNFLAAPLQDSDWKDAIQQCWGKPRAVAQAKSPAPR